MKILIVDDDPLMRRLYQRSFADHEVYMAQDGVDGLAMVMHHEGQFDLVVSDMSMPQMSGKDFYAHVAKAYPELSSRFVFCTGGSPDIQWLQKQSQPVLTKPFEIQDLYNVVKTVAGVSPWHERKTVLEMGRR